MPYGPALSVDYAYNYWIAACVKFHHIAMRARLLDLGDRKASVRAHPERCFDNRLSRGTGVPDDTTAFGHRRADSDAHRFDVRREKIDEAGRAPVLSMISAATLWLVLSSVFGVIASLKLHVPD